MSHNVSLLTHEEKLRDNLKEQPQGRIRVLLCGIVLLERSGREFEPSFCPLYPWAKHLPASSSNPQIAGLKVNLAERVLYLLCFMAFNIGQSQILSTNNKKFQNWNPRTVTKMV